MNNIHEEWEKIKEAIKEAANEVIQTRAEPQEINGGTKNAGST